MTQPSGSGGASFRVDMEQAPQAIKELKSALEQLRDVRADAVLMGTVSPGSRDSVSMDAARLIGAAAVGGPGSLVDALDAGIQMIGGLIKSMEVELANYETSDGDSARSFSGERNG